MIETQELTGDTAAEFIVQAISKKIDAARSLPFVFDVNSPLQKRYRISNSLPDHVAFFAPGDLKCIFLYHASESSLRSARARYAEQLEGHEPESLRDAFDRLEPQRLSAKEVIDRELLRLSLERARSPCGQRLSVSAVRDAVYAILQEAGVPISKGKFADYCDLCPSQEVRQLLRIPYYHDGGIITPASALSDKPTLDRRATLYRDSAFRNTLSKKEPGLSMQPKGLWPKS